MKIHLFPFLPFLIAIGCGISDAQEKKADGPAVEEVAADDTAPPVYLKAADTKAIMAKEGEKVTVYGKTTRSGKSRTGTNFVNFEDSEFYLITFKTDLIEFLRGEPADYYNKKRIAVTGIVTVFKDKPQFKLTDPSQVVILEEGAEFPPKADAAQPKVPVETPVTAAEKKEEASAEEEPAKKPPVDPKKYFK